MAQNMIIGFVIEFESKTMKEAMAYFPNLCCRSNGTSPFKPMCPVRKLYEISEAGLVKGKFLKDVKKGKKFSSYLSYISGVDTTIAPYALRIGGRTWLISKGMDRQFVDFLGTWKSPEASARY